VGLDGGKYRGLQTARGKKLKKSYKQYIEIQNRTGQCKEPKRESRIDGNMRQKGGARKKTKNRQQLNTKRQ
jgi:hypothetical protein